MIYDGENIVTITVALPDSARYAYIGLTGDNCRIHDVSIMTEEDPVAGDYIPRIAEEISYIKGPSGDKKPFGEDYREYALIRLDGENWEAEGTAENNLTVNMSDDFKGWDEWKEANRESGYRSECYHNRTGQPAGYFCCADRRPVRDNKYQNNRFRYLR